MDTLVVVHDRNYKRGWLTRQVDFVLAYPQASLQYDIYMSLLAGVQSRLGKDKVLKLNKNFYGQKQAGRQFHIYARDNLEKLGWIQSKIDKCVFYKEKSVLLMYVDDVFTDNVHLTKRSPVY